MRKLLIAVALLSAASAAQAQAAHDCRIRSVGINIFRSTTVPNNYRVVALYRGMDGAALSPINCPDQHEPNWIVDQVCQLHEQCQNVLPPDWTRLDGEGYQYSGTFAPGDHEVQILTHQRVYDGVTQYDQLFSAYRVFTVY